MNRNPMYTVGRQDELALLGNLLAAVRDGRGRAVEVLGEPGIGKTHLLSQLSLLARRCRIPVVAASADRYLHASPYGLVAEAFVEPLAALPDVQQQALRKLAGDSLAAVFPMLGGDGSASGSPRAHGPVSVYHAVRVLIEEIAAPAGLVILLDDIHRADSASIDVISYLLTHPPRASVLLAVACRPRQLPARLSVVLRQMADQGSLDTIELGPLSRADAGLLIGADHPPAEHDSLYAESGGNPLYLQALPQLNSPCPNGHGPVTDLPRTPDTALSAELDSLARIPRLVAESAAVLDDYALPEPLAFVAEVSIVDVLSALDELTYLDIVRPRQDSAGFVFRHPLLHRVAYRSTPAGWKIGAHARAAAYLAERGAPAAARAPHVAPTAGYGDGDAVALLAQAAVAVQGDAPDKATEWYAAALRLLPDNPQHHAQRVDLLAGYSQALDDSTRHMVIDGMAAPSGTWLRGHAQATAHRLSELGRLSPREREVAHLIAHGHTNRQIARSLTIKVSTVEVHVGRILKKLGVPSRAAVARVIALDEISPPGLPAAPV